MLMAIDGKKQADAAGKKPSRQWVENASTIQYGQLT
jgi:hypothetical protein